jgi:hypothetical protein
VGFFIINNSKKTKMKLQVITTIAASILMVSCGDSDSLTAELNELANELEKNNEMLADNAEAVAEEATIISEMYESEDGRFKVNFLGGTPEITTQSVPTELGDIEITMFLYEKSITEAYIIGYNDYPSAIVEAGSTADMLAGGKEGVINSMGVTQLDLEEEVSIDGHSGLHFKGVAKTMHIEYQMYLVENRLYQIGVIRDGSYVTQDKVDTFFGTFELTD